MRRDAREAAYKILYAEHFNDNTSEDFRKEIFAEQKLSENDIAFAEKLLDTIAENGEEIDSIISSYSKGYKIERLYVTDKCALTLAVAELKYFDDIPPVVSIDEALYLVRKYSADESLNFVNGVLAALKKDMEG